jgi:hypothetical protein
VVGGSIVGSGISGSSIGGGNIAICSLVGGSVVGSGIGSGSINIGSVGSGSITSCIILDRIDGDEIGNASRVVCLRRSRYLAAEKYPRTCRCTSVAQACANKSLAHAMAPRQRDWMTTAESICSTCIMSCKISASNSSVKPNRGTSRRLLNEKYPRTCLCTSVAQVCASKSPACALAPRQRDIADCNCSSYSINGGSLIGGNTVSGGCGGCCWRLSWWWRGR